MGNNGRGNGTRRPLDFYETAAWQTRALLKHVPEIEGMIVEPCAGDGSIVRVLKERGLVVTTNDIDVSRSTDMHQDATGLVFWSMIADRCDWVVSNIPYKMPDCLQIVQHAVATAKLGVALMLRITFPEPTAHIHPRGPWLKDNPPGRQLVLPRYSFSGDGRSDSTTTCWFVWSRKRLTGKPIVCLYNADLEFSSIQEIEQEARS